MPEALVEGENRRWRHLLRMDFLLKSSDWCRFQSLDPLTGYLCFPSTFGGKKREKERESVSPSYNFKWENYIKMIRITRIPFRIWDYYHLLWTPWVFTGCEFMNSGFPWGLPFLQWSLVKLMFSLVHRLNELGSLSAFVNWYLWTETHSKWLSEYTGPTNWLQKPSSTSCLRNRQSTVL